MKTVLLYDQGCRFCRWSASKVLFWDRNRELRPVDIFSPEGQEILRDLTPEEQAASWHLLIKGQVFSGGDAAAPLLALLPGGRAAGAVARNFSAATNRSYDFVASRRGSLGKLVSDNSDRFAWQRLRSRK